MRAKELIEIQRKEKVSPYLQDLGENFYQEVKELINRKYSSYSKLRDEDVSRFSLALQALQELENIKNIALDLYETRERKIVSNALYFVKSGEEIEYENLTKEEAEIMRHIINTLKDSRREILNFGIDRREIRTLIEEKKEEEEEEENISYITVRILRGLPSIAGIDGKVYGEFKAEDIVTLPESNARALINSGEAEKLKL